MDRKNDIKTEICDKSLKAFNAGLFAGTSGNMSYYLREEMIMLITPTSIRYELMQPADIVEMRLDGTVLNDGKPSSEWRLHAEIYKENEDVSAVFHTHSPHATAFAVNRMTIPATLIETVLFLGGDVPCAEYAPPGSQELGVCTAKAVHGRGGCLLANHGVVAVGSDLSQAYIRAEYIEDTAKITIMAKQIGTPVVLSQL